MVFLPALGVDLNPVAKHVDVLLSTHEQHDYKFELLSDNRKRTRLVAIPARKL